MRAIIIATAEQGAHTMVQVGSRPALHHQVDALNAHGVRDIVLLTGRAGRSARAPGVKVVCGDEVAHQGQLAQLFSVGPGLVGDVLLIVGDMLYSHEAVEALLACPAPGALIIEKQWSPLFGDRAPELCAEDHGWVTRISPELDHNRAFGAFTGMACFEGPLLGRLWARFARARAQGADARYQDAASLNEARLAHLINEAVEDEERLVAVPVEDRWRPLETSEDVTRAQAGLPW